MKEMKFEFNVVNPHEVDYEKSVGGNNGNYERLAVLVNGEPIGYEVYDCDYNIVSRDYIQNNLNEGIEIFFEDGKVVKKTTNNFDNKMVENFDFDKKKWEVDVEKTHPYF